MPRARRKKVRKASQAHDRRAQDLPLNAQVAAVEIDDPMALEPGEKIVALRSIRNDPLARLHSHHQIDEAQYRGGRAFQDDWEKAERGPRAVDPTREYVDGGQAREPITERQRRAVLRLNRIEHELGADGIDAGARGPGARDDDGTNRPAARAARPALDGLFLQAFSRVPRPAGVDLRLCIPHNPRAKARTP